MKRILCLMLVLVLAMSLCACGGDKKKDTAPSKPVNKPQDGMYLFHGYDLDGEITTDSLGAVSNPLNPETVENRTSFFFAFHRGGVVLMVPKSLSRPVSPNPFCGLESA